MRVRALELSAFRAWKELALGFGEHATVFVGGNGSGKTSILEAIWYAASLGSHRAGSDASLVSEGAEAAIVRADVERGGRTTRLELEIVTHGRARARLAGAPVRRRRDVLGTVRASLFAPERLSVVRGDPGERRRFADEMLVQLHPRYHAVISEYERALRQRNALLREHEGAGAPPGLDAWDEAIVGPGAELAAGRSAATLRLAPYATAAFAAVGAGPALGVSYDPNVPDPARAEPEAWASSMRARLAERRDDELARRTTLVGPHRDDVALTLDGMPARTHASQGESWLVVIALVLGMHRSISEAIDDQPVLLLDDPFAQLDPARRLRLVEAIPPAAQVLVTAADPSEVPAPLGAAAVDVAELRGG